MQLLRFSPRRSVRLASASGISVNRLPERSSDCRVLATGARLLTVSEVRPFSARLKCRRKRHLEDGRIPIANRSEELCLGVISCWLEPELPDDLRYLGVRLGCDFCREPCRDVVGLGGELLGCLAESSIFLPSEDPPLAKVWGLPIELRRSSANCELGEDTERAKSICLPLGLPAPHGIPGVDGVVGTWVFEDRLRFLPSASSRTMFSSKSMGSSTSARLTVRLRSCSASLSQPWNCRKSRSHISNELTFLKANSGTAVSNGNSSYPAMSLALWSGESRKAGIFVKHEYKYLISSRCCAICFSAFATLFDSVKVDHTDDMLDMTLRTLDTERRDSASVGLPRDLGACPRNET